MLARPEEGVATFGDLLIVRTVYHMSRVEKRNKESTRFREGWH